jgi:hypothetical protein
VSDYGLIGEPILADRQDVHVWFTRWRGTIVLAAGLVFFYLYLFTDAMHTSTWLIFGSIYVVAGAGLWLTRMRSDRRR